MTRSTLLTTAATAALFAVPGTAFAQDTAIDLGTIILSGALTPQDVSRTGATVEVLDAEDLATAPLSLNDTLARLPGVSFSSNGGLGTATTLQIRGLGNPYIGVRIDGIDVTDPSGTQNAFNFGGITTLGLGRVEVVKGSQSSLYGSEAVGGVVNITTARRDELGFGADVTVEAGSYNTYSGALGLYARTEEGGLAFNISRVTSDGFSARAGDDEDDGYEQTLATLSGDYALTDALTLGFSLLYRDAEVEIDRSTSDNTGVNQTEQSGGRVYAEIDAFGIDHTLSYATFTTDRTDPGGFTESFKGERQELSYLGTTEFGSTTVSFGLDRTEEEFDTDTNSGEDDTNSVFGEAIFRPSNDLDIAVSLRRDDSSDFGGATTGRVALAWQATPDTTIRAIAGTGFRAPSLFERFSSFGDPDLDPEESRSFEIGVEQRLNADSFVKATLFYTEIDDLIDFDGASTACSSGFGCYNQVPGTTVSQGIELSGHYAVTDAVAVYGNYTYTDAKTEDDRLARVPRHDLLLGVEAGITDRLSGYADVQYVADIEPSAFAPADNLVDDYTLVGLGLTYEISDTTEAYVRAENLFDEEYETAGGFNQPGQSFFAGIRASF